MSPSGTRWNKELSKEDETMEKTRYLEEKVSVLENITDLLKKWKFNTQRYGNLLMIQIQTF